MSGDASGALLTLLGALSLRLGLTDAHLAYVKPGMRLPLLVAGGLLVALGLGVMRRWVAGARPPGGGHGTPVGWLLIAPVFAIGLVAPDPLGAFAASRQPEAALPPVDSFGPLPDPVDGAVALPVREFTARARYDEERSLTGVRVRLTGFVVPDRSGTGFFLTRFVLSCCAADGRAVRVAVRDAPRPYPPADAWVEVEGTWRPTGETPESEAPSVLVASAVRPVPAPSQPYET